MKKFLLAIALLAIIPQNAFGLAQPPSSDSTATSMPLMCLAGTRCIYKSSGPQSVIRFTVSNTSAGSMDLTGLTIHYTGTANNTDLGKISWWDDVNGVFLGEADINFATKSASLAGVLTSIPAATVIEVTGYVNVKANATLGHTATFTVEAGDITTSSGAAASSYPITGPLTQVCNPPTIGTPVTTTVMTPNGGETYIRGAKQQLVWRTDNAPLGSYVRKVELYKGGVFVRYIDTETTPRSFIGSKLCPSQSARWNVPTDLVPGNNYRIRVKLYKGTTDSPNQIETDQSDTTFRIE